jgi:ribonuclease HII
MRLGGPKPSLLLHACCAPCASVPAHRLREDWNVRLMVYAPNIHPRAEHDRRLGELERLARAWGLELMVEPGPAEDWARVVQACRDAPEGGLSPRCRACFGLRLGRAAELARASGCAAFTTSLTVGRLKRSAVVLEVGREAGLAAGVPFLDEDFKKRDGFGQSLAFCRELGLVRQDYCGCAPSLAEARRRARHKGADRDAGGTG